MLFTIFSLFIACQSKEDDTGVSEDTGGSEDTGEEGIDCTADFRTSANITIVDQQGAPLPGVDVSYTVDGEEGMYMETWDDGIYHVGGEEAGDFVVSMYIELLQENDPCCFDVGEGTLEFTIEEDECHVITQAFEAELEWSIVCLERDENGVCE